MISTLSLLAEAVRSSDVTGQTLELCALSEVWTDSIRVYERINKHDVLKIKNCCLQETPPDLNLNITMSLFYFISFPVSFPLRDAVDGDTTARQISWWINRVFLWNNCSPVFDVSSLTVFQTHWCVAFDVHWNKANWSPASFYFTISSLLLFPAINLRRALTFTLCAESPFVYLCVGALKVFPVHQPRHRDRVLWSPGWLSPAPHRPRMKRFLTFTFGWSSMYDNIVSLCAAKMAPWKQPDLWDSPVVLGPLVHLYQQDLQDPWTKRIPKSPQDLQGVKDQN